MKSKRVFRFFLLLLLLAAVGIGVAVWLTLQTPAEYAQRIDIPQEVRKENLQKVEEKKVQLLEEVETKPEWSFSLSEIEANSWLASEEFSQEVGVHLPPEITTPRVQFNDNELVLAFRITHNDFQGVVMAPLKIVSVDENEVQIRIEKVTTGLLPFSWHQILEETLRDQEDSLPVGVTWSETDEEEGTVITLAFDQLAELDWKVDDVRIESGNLFFKGSRAPLSDTPSRSDENRAVDQPPSEPAAEPESTVEPGG